MTILTVCKQLLGPSTSPAPLPVVAKIFDRLNECYRVHVEQEQQMGGAAAAAAAAAAAQWFVDSEFHNSRRSLDAGERDCEAPIAAVAVGFVSLWLSAQALIVP